MRGGADRKRHPDFAATYAAMARRRGKKIATTAIARKLLTRAFHLLESADADTAAAPASRRAKKSSAAVGSASTTPAKVTTANNTSTTSPSGTRRTRAQTRTVASPGRARKTA